MLNVVTLLLLIFTVSGISSNLEYYSSDQESSSPDLFLPYDNHRPLNEVLDVSNREALKIRKVRETTDNSDALTQNPFRSRKRSRENYGETRYQESSYPENIPVTVIYDSEPTTSRDKSSTVVKVKRRKHPKEPQPTDSQSKTEETPEEKDVVTEKTASTSPAPRTIVPKVFTKRPPEFNPVFKKIRQRDPVVKIIDEKNYVYAHSGNFHYSFEGGDGTKVSSQGELKSIENDKTGEAVIGSVFYKDNEGNDVSLSYTADENGYRPQGAHLPTPPPVPPAIARALKYLATATTPEPVTKPTKEKN